MNMRLTIIILVTFLTSINCYSQDSLLNRDENSQEISRLKDDVQEIRRDQLNYKIEKDLLKETYSSNYTTIQIVISLILGLFAVLGYLGLKGITSLKREYDLELTKIREIKADFELKLKELSAAQTKVEKQIVSIDTLNEQQSLKIKLLEIKEKASTYFNQKAYRRSIEYAAVGLEINKDDIELLRFRAYSLLKLKSYGESIEAHKKLLLTDPTDSISITNLAELYLFVNQVENYDKLVGEKSEYFTTTNSQLLTYFEALKIYQHNEEHLINFLKGFMKTQDLTITKNRLDNWGLEDLFDLLKDRPNSKAKTLLTNFVSYLNGTVSGQQFVELLT